MDLIKLCDAVRQELYPDLKLIETSIPVRRHATNPVSIPLRSPVATNPVSTSAGIFPYEEIWPRTYSVILEPHNPVSCLCEMLRLERYLFRDNAVVCHQGPLWIFDEKTSTFFISCAVLEPRTK